MQLRSSLKLLTVTTQISWERTMSQSQGVSYRKAVLIIWDMQNGIAPGPFNFKEIVKNARLLIDTAHKFHIPIIYSQRTGALHLWRSEATNGTYWMSWHRVGMTLFQEVYC
jgi:nicotinamidase-related amidase